MKLKLMLCITLAIVIVAVPAMAQDEYSKVDVSGGFSLLRAKAEGETELGNVSVWTNLYGWQASVAYNLNPNFAIEGDISGQYDSPVSNYFFLGGPKYIFTRNRVAPFAHFLIGITHTGVDIPDVTVLDNDNLTLCMGGGLDVRVSPWLSVRPFQIDYITVKLGEPSNLWSDNVRFGFGGVLHLD